MVVVLAVEQVETAVLAAAEQRDVLHRRVVVGSRLIEPTPKRGVRLPEP